MLCLGREERRQEERGLDQGALTPLSRCVLALIANQGFLQLLHKICVYRPKQRLFGAVLIATPPRLGTLRLQGCYQRVKGRGLPPREGGSLKRWKGG